MNPADVAQSTLPLASSDVSLIALFWQAHWVVKCVMLGLLSCSVWVWAIAIDKILLYARTKRAMDKFKSVDDPRLTGPSCLQDSAHAAANASKLSLVDNVARAVVAGAA